MWSLYASGRAEGGREGRALAVSFGPPMRVLLPDAAVVYVGMSSADIVSHGHEKPDDQKVNNQFVDTLIEVNQHRSATVITDTWTKAAREEQF